MTRKPQFDRAPTPGDARDIDLRYGLEPVFEPGRSKPKAGDPGGLQFQQVQCPYCGEAFETAIDTSAGSARYVEDCQVCCQAIEFNLDVDIDGMLAALSVARSD